MAPYRTDGQNLNLGQENCYFDVSAIILTKKKKKKIRLNLIKGYRLDAAQIEKL